MKHAILVVIAAIAFGSCKKVHTCRCSVTITYSNGQERYNSKTTMMKEKYTKKQAAAICEREEDNLEVTYRNIFTNNGRSKPNAVAESQCLVE